MSEGARQSKLREDSPGGLDAIARTLKQQSGAEEGRKRRGPAPVHLWNPPFCGDLDIRIKADGTWFYLGTPIGRRPLVELFASVLRKDEDGKTYLVTPVEKIGITVDDAPFVAVDIRRDEDAPEQRLIFETNLGETVVLGPDHPLRVVTDPETDEPRPYIHVRGRLEALVDRKSFYRLAALGEMREEADGTTAFGVVSEGAFFAIARGDGLRALVEDATGGAGRSGERA